MDAAQALADLTEISAQIRRAVIASHDGEVVASTLADDHLGGRLASTALELLSAADEARGDAGEPLVQLQAATADGSVFVVRDDRHVVAAVTAPEPTVGLVFYDLKTCLRLLEREQAEQAEKEEAKAGARRRRKKDEGDAS